MPIVADTHVHLYGLYDTGHFFSAALDNLAACGKPDDTPVLMLTEAGGCQAFKQLREGGIQLPDFISVSHTSEEDSLRILCGERELTLIAGRQIVSSERMEILGLTRDQAPEDGTPAADIITGLLEQDAVPVLAWAPGKWMFKRAGVVRDLCERFPDSLWLGDSRMRPIGWPTPSPMRTSALPVLAGSDPLPVSGEEVECGRYGIRLPVDLDRDRPAAFLREALRSPAVTTVGRRNSFPGMLRRFLAHHRAKSGSA